MTEEPDRGPGGGPGGRPVEGAGELPSLGRDVLLAMVDRTTDAVLLLDEEGRIRWASPSVVEASGWSPEEVTAFGRGELVHPEDRDVTLAALGALFAAEPGTHSRDEPLVVRLRTRAGEYRWTSVTGRDLRDDPKVRGVVLALRDADDDVLARHAVEASERRFRALVLHGSDVTFTFGDDMHVTSVSASARELYGVEPEDMLGVRAFANVLPPDREMIEGVLEDLRRRPGGTASARVRARVAGGPLRVYEGRVTNLLRVAEVGEWVCNFWDVTAEVQAEDENRRLLEIFELTGDVVLHFSADGTLRYLNAAAREFLGLDDATVAARIGEVWADEPVLPPGVMELVLEDDFTSWGGEVTGQGAEGPVPLALQVLAHRDAAGRLTHISALARDISDRKRLQATLEHQATHDPLTGLPNRALLFERIAAAVEGLRAGGRGHVVGLLFIDLDHFKVINDSLGHALGDQLLRAIGRRIRSAVRPGDTVGRFGGDEFVVLCERLDTEDDAVVIAHRIEQTLQRPFEVGGHEIHAGTSIGIAFADPDEADPAAVLRDADTAMYRAKSVGRGRWVMFDDELRRQAVERQRVETSLRHARSGEDLELHFQPVVELATGRIVGAEALLRWHRDGQLVPPAEFVPVAEETGLIVPIGEWVLRTACAQLAEWRGWEGWQDLGIAVNASTRQLQHAGFVPTVLDLIREFGLGSGALAVEITESVVLDDVGDASLRLQELREAGIRIAVDDFGTGYSSLTYLHRLPLDLVKLDRAFVAGVGTRPADTAIVTAVLQLAEVLGLRAIAEGIESGPQLTELRGLGCTFGQGFHLARPMPAEEFGELIRRTRVLPAPPSGDPRP
ncbi:MAG: sensor domain-containing protein [Microthrixaceae bacterium]